MNYYWLRFIVWFNRTFRPLVVTKPGDFVLVRIRSIIPSPFDVRELEAFQIRLLAEQIESTGDVSVPILLNTGRLLLAGRYRLAACQRLGWTHIPARVVASRSLEAMMSEAVIANNTALIKQAKVLTGTPINLDPPENAALDELNRLIHRKG